MGFFSSKESVQGVLGHVLGTDSKTHGDFGQKSISWPYQRGS